MFQVSKPLVLAAVGLLVVSACTKTAKLDNDQQKASYAIGQQIGSNMKSQSVDVDVDALSAGLTDAIKGKEARLKPEEMQAAMGKLQEASMKKHQESGEKNAAEGKAFLEKNKGNSNIKTTASGLQYEVVKEGSGPKPKATDVVSVHYTGTLINGTKFDSSVDRGQPAEFPLNGVIPGWTEGLQLMPVGSKYKFYIPSELAYGARDQGPIPANSVLIFDVELLEIKKDDKGAAAKKK
jgi:FKBP-type peptidyl-prolyl cis-trans isomerase